MNIINNCFLQSTDSRLFTWQNNSICLWNRMPLSVLLDWRPEFHVLMFVLCIYYWHTSLYKQE